MSDSFTSTLALWQQFALLLTYSFLLIFLVLGGGRSASIPSLVSQAPRKIRRRDGSLIPINATYVKASRERCHLVFPALCNQRHTEFCPDTGAKTSMITPEEVRRLGLTPFERHSEFVGVGGQPVVTSHSVRIPLMFFGTIRYCEAVVSEHTPLAPVLIGMDWLTKNKAIIDVGRARLLFGSGTTKKFLAALMETPELKATTTGTVDPELLKRFPKLFSEATSLPPSRKCDMNIRMKPGQLPGPSEELVLRDPADIAFLHSWLEKLLKQGFVIPDHAPEVNACSAFVVKDKASDTKGTTEPKRRAVLDYRQLNAVHDMDHALLPRIIEVVRKVSKAKFFGKMDLSHGFGNLRLHPDAEKYTVFSVQGKGNYRWKVVPMGLANAPGAMERFMRLILRELLDEGVEVYLDDVLVYADTQEQYDDLLERVLKRLEENEVHLKPSKCAFGVSEVDFLGYRIGNGVYKPMHSNVQGILDFAPPTTVKAWQRFHGMINFYRQHVPTISNLVKPITMVFSRKGKVPMTPDLQKSFDMCKQEIAKKLSLESLDPALPVYLITDASPFGWGAYVTQDRSLKSPGLAWLSGTFSPAEQRWHQNVRELFAVVASVRKYPELFAGRKVTVLTDSKVITSWVNMKMTSDKLTRWNEDMLKFDLSFEHIPGSENVVTDALSRQLEELGKAAIDERSVLHGLTVNIQAWLETRFSCAKTSRPVATLAPLDFSPKREGLLRSDALAPTLVLKSSPFAVLRRKSESTSVPPAPLPTQPVPPPKTETPHEEMLFPDPCHPRKPDGIPPPSWLLDDMPCRAFQCNRVADLDGKCLIHHTKQDAARALAVRRAKQANTATKQKKLWEEAIQDSGYETDASDRLVWTGCPTDCRTRGPEDMGWLCHLCEKALGRKSAHPGIWKPPPPGCSDI
jgi:hypothetical protein